MEPRHVHHRVLSRKVTSLPPMVLPFILHPQSVTHLPIRHGRTRETTEYGWFEPDGVDSDWIQLARWQGGESGGPVCAICQDSSADTTRHLQYYWTGTAMLLTLAWLCFASLTPLRRRWYEMFKVSSPHAHLTRPLTLTNLPLWTFQLLHWISAILFSAFFYLHCNALLTSWNYLYATAGLYGISFLMRLFLIVFRNGAHVPKATIEILPEDAVRLTIPTPHHRWKAGQHVFLNFCKARLLESHPYTVCNTANPDVSTSTSSSQCDVLTRWNDG